MFDSHHFVICCSWTCDLHSCRTHLEMRSVLMWLHWSHLHWSQPSLLKAKIYIIPKVSASLDWDILQTIMYSQRNVQHSVFGQHLFQILLLIRNNIWRFCQCLHQGPEWILSACLIQSFLSLLWERRANRNVPQFRRRTVWWVSDTFGTERKLLMTFL